MGGAIFSNANRVVSKDINHRNFHDRCETQRTSSIVAKDQKTGAKSSELSQCQSVQDRSHRMLANSEMNISPSEGIATNLTGIRKSESRLGRGRKIRGTADQPLMLLSNRVQHFAGGIS